MNLKYDCTKITVNFATSATTAVSADIPGYVQGELLGIKIAGIDWPVRTDAATGASAVVVEIKDPESTVILNSTSVTSGGTTCMSAQWFGIGASAHTMYLRPGSTMVYSIKNVGGSENRCVSAGNTPSTSLPFGYVWLYYEM